MQFKRQQSSKIDKTPEHSAKGEILGCHAFPAAGIGGTDSLVLNINDHIISITTEGRNDKTRDHIFGYKRLLGKEIVAEKLLTSVTEEVTLCILPVPPLYALQNICNHLCLKFKSPIVVDQDQKLDFYTKMPIEIGIFKQSHKKGLLLIDCISLCKQQYTLYGTPESGMICRYKETEISATEVETSKFEEASLSARLLNETNKIIELSKLVIPLSTIVVDYSNDNSYLSSIVEIKVGTSFGKDIANVEMVSAKIWDSESSTIRSKENVLTFLMDKGF
ncbi:MAG TPA: DUF432 domain-containing protein [Nitrososphaeraceae archaeon]|nr:DUF432 domain-containing protein [Nitrososphaeraceae archaeon]